MDEELEQMTLEELVAEVTKLRQGIREHRDSTLHELCWHHPALWSLLPEKTDPLPTVPAWPEFMEGCIRYRRSLDEQLPNAPRTNEPYPENYLIPTAIETERLHLRMFREDDWRDIHAYYGDPECAKYTSGQPLKDYETWQKVAALVGHWSLRNYGSYAIAEKISGKVIGVAGLDYPLDWPEPEIQWGLARTYWGKGYASEAVRGLKRMSREYVPDLSLISLIHPNNSNSIALAKAVGAHFEKECLFRGDTWLIFRH